MQRIDLYNYLQAKKETALSKGYLPPVHGDRYSVHGDMHLFLVVVVTSSINDNNSYTADILYSSLPKATSVWLCWDS